MKKKIALRKLIALVLVFGLIITVVPNNSFVLADESSNDTASVTDAEEEKATEEQSTTEEEVETPDEESKETTPTFDKIYNGVSVEGLDFSSCELLIGTEDAGIFTADTEVISEYDGIYLTRFNDPETTKYAYTYYYGVADLVEINTDLKICDNEGEEVPEASDGEADLSNLNQSDDAFSILNNEDIDTKKGYIALIDTGAEIKGSVKESVSVIGEDTEDLNGHGTKLASLIEDTNKDAKILSIKVADKSGTASVQSIYAAIQYAIEAKVSVINISMSSIKTAESQLLEDAINEATEKNIIVVVSAGNNGKNAKYYTPANIKNAYTIGSCDKDGKVLATSNYGEVVDYYVEADSTSEAAAIFSSYAVISLDEAIKNSTTIKTDEEETEEEIEEKDDGETLAQVDSKPDSVLEYDLGGGLWRSANQRDTSSEDDNRTWWYLGWYESGTLKWSAKAYCLDYDKRPPTTDSPTTIYEGANPNIVKSYFWSKADLIQYYNGGSTIHEQGDPQSPSWAKFNWNYGNMSNTATSTLVRYASSGSSEYGRSDLPTAYNSGEADWTRIKDYSFPDSTAKYIAWNDGRQASSKWPNKKDWYEAPNFMNIYIVKASTSAVGSGRFTNLPTQQSDWIWSKTNHYYTLKNKIKFNAASNGDIAMFIGTVPDNTRYEVYNSSGTLMRRYQPTEKFVLYSGDSLQIETTDFNKSKTIKETNTIPPGNHAYSYYVSIKRCGGADTQRMGYLNSKQSPSLQFAYSVPKAPTHYVYLKKTSSKPAYTNGNPNYSLAGVQYAVYTDEDCTDYVTTLTTTGDNTTNDSGTSQKYNITDKMTYSNGVWQKTNFWIKELNRPTGYAINTKAQRVEVGGDFRDENDPYTFNAEDAAGTDPFTIGINKTDSTGSTTMNGDNTLEGAQFTVKFYPQATSGNFNPSTAAGKSWVFQTMYNSADDEYTLRFDQAHLVSGDTTYFNGNNQLDLPYGFVTVEESKAPEGYKKGGDFYIQTKDGTRAEADSNGKIVLKITADGESVLVGSQYKDVSETGTATAANVQVRADIKITKVDENDEPMEGVVFEVNSLDANDNVLQTVKLVTDENGFVSTANSYVAHNVNTNGGVAKCGTWFGDPTHIDLNLGALYAGKYEIRELRCDANKGKQLERKQTIIVNDTVDGLVLDVFDPAATDSNSKITNLPTPEIHTTAIVQQTQTQTMGQTNEAVFLDDTGAVPAAVDWTNQTIVDTITYERLRADTNYVAYAQLMLIDRETLTVSPYMEDDGTGTMVPYARIQPFKTDASYQRSIYEKSGTVDVTLDKVDPTGHENEILVVYETIYLDTAGNIQTVADIPDDANAEQYDGYTTLTNPEMEFFPLKHCDPDVVEQQIYPFDLHTTAMGEEETPNIGYAGNNKLIDRCYVTGLTIGETYKISGVLYMKDKADEDGNPPSSGNNTIVNNNICDDKYILKDDNGNVIKATKEFIAEFKDGYIDLEFEFDQSLLEGERVVALEETTHNGKVIGVHADLEDADEAYYVGSIHTTTRNSEVDKTKVTNENKESSKEVLAAEGSSFIDEISYSHLLSSRKYHIKGVLMDKATGEVMKDATGKEIVAETYYETKKVGEVALTDSPNAKDYVLADGTKLDMSADHADYLDNGTIELKFEGYDFTTLADKVGVVYEYVYIVVENPDGTTTEKLCADHTDINDVDQFTYWVGMGTKATDMTTNTQVAPAKTKTTVKDEISIKNAIVGKTYTIKATFHVANDKSGKYKDGDLLLDANGNPVTAEIKYTAKEKNGTAVVEIPLDTTVLESMRLTVYEDMYNEWGILISSHSNLEDKGQQIFIPGGKTTATDKDGKKEVKANTKVTIYDKLTFTNLKTDGTQYTATGTIYVKETGEPLTDENGKPYTNTVKFTPSTPDGYVTIPIEISTEKLGGKKLVVFEDVLIDEKTIFIEHSLDNSDQTVDVKPPTSPPKTGTIALFILLGVVAAGGAGMLIFRRKKLN